MGNLKGVKVAACDMKCTDLTKEAVTILRIHFSHDIQSEENYLNRLLKIEQVLKL